MSPDLIKAFAAQASEEAIKTVSVQGAEHNAIIEDDQQVHTMDNTS